MSLFTHGGNATFSQCGRYRYSLTRQWSPIRHPVVFVMLNPSTADANADDPTIRRCAKFAHSWGYGGIAVVNLFAFRSTDPAALKATDDPIGRDNDAHIISASRDRYVIAAWGAHPFATERAAAVLKLLENRATYIGCLGTTKDGHPRHPLYVKGDTEPVTFPLRPSQGEQNRKEQPHA